MVKLAEIGAVAAVWAVVAVVVEEESLEDVVVDFDATSVVAAAAVSHRRWSKSSGSRP